MHKKGIVGLVIMFIIIAVLVFFVLGYYGSQHAKKIGAECNLGVSEYFCWEWTKVVEVGRYEIYSHK